MGVCIPQEPISIHQVCQHFQMSLQKEYAPTFPPFEVLQQHLLLRGEDLNEC